MEPVGFQYWKDSSMLLGVNSKNQEKMRDDWKNLMNENKFYLRKMKKMQKKMKELEETKKRLEDCIEEDTKRYINCDKRWRERGTQIYNLEEENKRLKLELKAYEKDALNSGQIALRQEQEIKDLKLELKAAQEVSVVYMKRYEQKAKEERQIDEICSRIKCEDTLGHLIGKVPHH